MDRRTFLKQGTGALLALQAGRRLMRAEEAPEPRQQFRTANESWQNAYDKAMAVLSGNVRILPFYSRPVLIEGGVYQRLSGEGGPHEGLIYSSVRRDVARNNQMGFFAKQREDGLLPHAIKDNEIGWRHLQLAVPLVATAWELSQKTGDSEMLETAYNGWSRFDAWLRKYRNMRGTGLCEGFCTFDTGMDNSPRWKGIPGSCPDDDARKCWPIPTLPRLCPDMSATVYGGRVALAAMAKTLGRSNEADRWSESAEQIRSLILGKLYVPEDAAFYDLDAQDHFVKIQCENLARVCGEHIPDQKMFDALWEREIHSPQAYWTPYPMPSVAADDPQFVSSIPSNSWGGATQALTALRATRWMDHYGRSAEFSEMMDRWCEAIARDLHFLQQMSPFDGKFTRTQAGNYSPCALVMMDYTWRLAGIHEEPQCVSWNVRPGHPAAQSARFWKKTDADREAVLEYDAKGARLTFAGREVARVEGGAVRLVTAKDGVPMELRGIATKEQKITLQVADSKPEAYTIAANQRIPLSGAHARSGAAGAWRSVDGSVSPVGVLR